MGRDWRSLLEVDCFVGVEFAVLYGDLCLVAANGDFCVLGCACLMAGAGFEKDPHLRREGVGNRRFSKV
jgi:hypothetical protein